VAGGWRRLHNEELHNLYGSPDIIRVINSRREEPSLEDVLREYCVCVCVCVWTGIKWIWRGFHVRDLVNTVMNLWVT